MPDKVEPQARFVVAQAALMGFDSRVGKDVTLQHAPRTETPGADAADGGLVLQLVGPEVRHAVGGITTYVADQVPAILSPCGGLTS